MEDCDDNDDVIEKALLNLIQQKIAKMQDDDDDKLADVSQRSPKSEPHHNKENKSRKVRKLQAG